MTQGIDASQKELKKNPAAAGTAVQFLTFTIGQDEYAVDIMSVREIKGWTDTTRLPNTPPFMRGVINLRGLIIPIFDLRTRFNMGVTEITPKHVVVILAVGTRTIGILVDAVSDILDVHSGEIQPPPDISADAKDQCISGLISSNGRMVVLLAVERLIDVELLKEAEKISGTTA